MTKGQLAVWKRKALVALRASRRHYVRMMNAKITPSDRPIESECACCELSTESCSECPLYLSGYGCDDIDSHWKIINIVDVSLSKALQVRAKDAEAIINAIDDTIARVAGGNVAPK